jgi:hypothetical protein
VKRFIYAITILFVVSCATSPSTIQSTQIGVDLTNETIQQISSIEKWSLGFEYKNITIEEKIENDVVTEKIITDHGYSDFSLAMRDNIIEVVNQKYGSIILERENRTENGAINLHIVRTTSYAYIGENTYNIRVFFKNSDGSLLFEKLINDEYWGRNMDQLVNDVAKLILLSLN